MASVSYNTYSDWSMAQLLRYSIVWLAGSLAHLSIYMYTYVYINTYSIVWWPCLMAQVSYFHCPIGWHNWLIIGKNIHCLNSTHGSTMAFPLFGLLVKVIYVYPVCSSRIFGLLISWLSGCYIHIFHPLLSDWLAYWLSYIYVDINSIVSLVHT